MRAAEAPRAGHLQPRSGRGCGGIEVAAELVDEAPDLLQIELVGASKGVEDAGLNAALRVPLAFDELEIARVRAALAW